MTTLIPGLERELLHAAYRTAPEQDTTGAPHESPTRRVGAGRRRTALAATALTASIVVGGTAYAAKGLWAPEIGTEASGRAVATADPVPQTLLSTLGVLRRSQTATDRDAAVRAVLRGAGPGVGAVRTNEVRRLGTLPDGRVAVLAPARVPQGFDPTLPNMTRDQLLLAVYDPATSEMSGFISSDALGLRAGDLMWPVGPRLTASQRARARTFEDNEVAAGRLEKLSVPPYYGVMSVEQGDRYRKAVGIANDDPVTYIGVVPDGVTRVRVDGRTTVPVRDNFFVAPSTIGSTQQTEWLDQDGHTIPFASTLGAWH